MDSNEIQRLRNPGRFSETELEVITKYRDGLNWALNNRIRLDSSHIGKDESEALDILESLFTELKSPITLYRSIYTELGQMPKIQIPSLGGLYSDLAFLSCTTSFDYAEHTLIEAIDYQWEADTVLTIEVDAGERILVMPESKRYSKEYEILLPRETLLRIYEDTGFINGIRRLKTRVTQ